MSILLDDYGYRILEYMDGLGLFKASVIGKSSRRILHELREEFLREEFGAKLIENWHPGSKGTKPYCERIIEFPSDAEEIRFRLIIS